MTVIDIPTSRLTLADGSSYEITDWVDAKGEPCEPDVAAHVLAEAENGEYLLIDLSAFKPVANQ